MNASLTYDPGVGPGNHSGMNFTWHYGVIIGNYSSPFTGLNGVTVQYSVDKRYGSVIIYDITRLSVNQTYLVQLVVTKDYRNSSAIQIVRLVNGDPPKISQRYRFFPIDFFRFAMSMLCSRNWLSRCNSHAVKASGPGGTPILIDYAVLIVPFAG